MRQGLAGYNFEASLVAGRRPEFSPNDHHKNKEEEKEV